MAFEKFKQDILDLTSSEIEELKLNFEKQLGIELPRPPIEILAVEAIRKQVGEEPFIHYNDIDNIEDARNSILATCLSIRVMGKKANLIFKCKTDESLNLEIIGHPEINDISLRPDDLNEEGELKPDYKELISNIIQWVNIIKFIIENALKIMGKG